MDELRGYRFANDAPNLANIFVGMTRIYTKVVASEKPRVQVGDTANMLVETDGKSYAELKAAVQNCEGPVFTLFQRIFKFFRPPGRCGAIDNRNIV